MTRPRGVIRQALLASAAQLSGASPMGGVTWRDAASHAQVGFSAAETTWRNMRRAGDLVDVRAVRMEHASRPMMLCRPAAAPPASAGTEAGGCAGLVEAVRSWAQFA